MRKLRLEPLPLYESVTLRKDVERQAMASFEHSDVAIWVTLYTLQNNAYTFFGLLESFATLESLHELWAFSCSHNNDILLVCF